MRQHMAGFDVHQWPLAQPVQKLVQVGRAEKIAKRVAPARAHTARSKRQRPQIMITQHHGCALTQPHDAAQRRGGRGATVDQVADKPQPAFGLVRDFGAGQQRIQEIHATMHVANRPD